MYDVLIVGSGPAGLSAALTAQQIGLDYLVLERSIIAQTIREFPVARKLFSTGDDLELNPNDLPKGYKPTREELLSYYYGAAVNNRLNIRTGVEAEKIEVQEDLVRVISTDGSFSSRTVLVCIGGFGIQRRLGIPGETENMVSYRFAEAYPYALKPVLVVGGGNSAAEAALALHEVGAGVTFSVRRSSLDLPPSMGDGSDYRAQIKPWVRAPLDDAVGSGKINLVTSSQVTEIGGGWARLRVNSPDGKEPAREELVDCSHVFALIGAEPDTSLLRTAGAEIANDSRPVYNPETYETTAPRVYVAGHLTRERHIRNAVSVARSVVEKIGAEVLDECRV